MEMVNEATMRRLESIQKSRINFLLNTIVDNEERKTLNSPTLSLLDKVEQGQFVRADNLIGGYSYTSQFWDQQKIAQVAKEYCRSMGNTTTPSYEDLEESRQLPPTDLDRRLLIVPEERGKHQCDALHYFFHSFQPVHSPHDSIIVLPINSALQI